MSVVDAGEAGEGNLEILVSAANTNIPTRVEPLGNARFGVSFVPKQPTDHLIYVTFNDEPVPGSPFECSVTSQTSSHEYHTHISPPSHLTGHVPHISHSHISHTTHVTQPPPASHIYPPLTAQITYSPVMTQKSHRETKSEVRSRTHRNHVTQTLESCQLIKGNFSHRTTK